ncbi:hypothetical protein PRVXH_000776 [Proteinivorax hydrogeniformans]|uniref:ABC-2 family transporter n=1 Tax=Proteinivorax hydrogeniformans TaxID=1826727 RepID=A0AAU8HVN2_9FIRM
MSRIINISLYQLRDFRKAVFIYYAIILGLGLFFINTARAADSASMSNVGGPTTVIFLFILGLNCFTDSYNFMQANNITRVNFFFGNALAIIAVSAIMAMADVLIIEFFTANITYTHMVVDIYSYSNIITNFLWYVIMFALFTNLGWMVTMIYYRSNTVMKVLVSISPFVLRYVLSHLNRMLDGRVANAIGDFFSQTFKTPYLGMVTMLLATILILGINYLLMWKTPVKR